jgi:acetolactate synthase-1/2/3 large subunit
LFTYVSSEIGKNRRADVPIVGDARDVTWAMARELARAVSEKGNPDRSAWLNQLKDWQERFPLRYDQSDDGPIKPQYVVERVYEATRGEATIVSGVGQHQMWTSQFYKFSRPRQFINSGGLGTMGFAVPAALGAKVARPDQTVFAIDGDGCFQMTAQELATCAYEDIPIVVGILNNGVLGMVRQWQELFYDRRESGVHFGFDYPDYVKLAEAYGGIGLRAETPDDVDAVIDKALSVKDKTVVIDFRVDPSEMVFPMVPAGGSNDDVILGPEQAQPANEPADAPIA